MGLLRSTTHSPVEASLVPLITSLESKVMETESWWKDAMQPAAVSWLTEIRLVSFKAGNWWAAQAEVGTCGKDKSAMWEE